MISSPHIRVHISILYWWRGASRVVWQYFTVSGGSSPSERRLPYELATNLAAAFPGPELRALAWGQA